MNKKDKIKLGSLILALKQLNSLNHTACVFFFIRENIQASEMGNDDQFSDIYQSSDEIYKKLYELDGSYKKIIQNAVKLNLLEHEPIDDIYVSDKYQMKYVEEKNYINYLYASIGLVHNNIKIFKNIAETNVDKELYEYFLLEADKSIEKAIDYAVTEDYLAQGTLDKFNQNFYY